MGIFCDIISVFTVTFDQFNLLQIFKKLTDPKLLNSIVCVANCDRLSFWHLYA